MYSLHIYDLFYRYRHEHCSETLVKYPQGIFGAIFARRHKRDSESFDDRLRSKTLRHVHSCLICGLAIREKNCSLTGCLILIALYLGND